MADNTVEYIVRAQDNASVVLNHIAGGVSDLRGAVDVLTRSAGPFGALTAGFLGMAAAVGAGAIALANEVEQADRLESITGVASDKLRVMQQILREGGGDAEGLQGALVKLNRALQDEDPMLARIGVTSRDTFTAYRQLAGIITASSDAKARDAVATHLLGKAGADLIPDLKAIVDNFDAMHAALKRNGTLMSGEAVEAARQLDGEMDSLSRNWEGAMNRIKAVTTPVVLEIVQGFNTMWDAVSGVDRSRDLPSVERQLADAESRIRRLQQEANAHGGSAWNANEMNGMVLAAARLRKLRDELLGTDSGVDRMRSLHEAGGSGPDGLAAALRGSGSGVDAFAIANRGWFAGKGETSATDRQLAEISTFYEQHKLALKNMGKTMQEVEVPVLRLTEAGIRAGERLDLIADTFNSLSSSVQADMSAISAVVLSGTMNLREAWHQLMRAILSDMASSAADFGIGLLFDLIPIPGAGAVGGKINDVFSSTASRGGDTYNISALSARDVLQELTSPTGSLRGANDYVRTVSRASRR